ncbi:MAG: hypothetical protein HFJ06_03210 [Lachnospiraceae bacterium]|nr:hypothetical protein [Lachnospiraceae bacterium]
MEIIYENHLGEKLNLTQWPFMIQNPENLLGTEWSYSQSGNTFDFFRELKEKEAVISVFADNEAEYTDVISRMLVIFEKDVIEGIPGKIWLNGYYLQCFIKKSEYDEFEEDFYTTDKKIAILAKKWTWIKETKISYVHEDIPDLNGRGYPYRYPFDYSRGKGYTGILNNNHFADCDFSIRIRGYTKNPYIKIGDNIYRINGVIPLGDILEIDSQHKKITLTKENGMEENFFKARDRGNYIFKKIPSGQLDIYWNGSFDFDVTLLEERSEPDWT